MQYSKHHAAHVFHKRRSRRAGLFKSIKNRWCGDGTRSCEFMCLWPQTTLTCWDCAVRGVLSQARRAVLFGLGLKAWAILDPAKVNEANTCASYKHKTNQTSIVYDVGDCEKTCFPARFVGSRARFWVSVIGKCFERRAKRTRVVTCVSSMVVRRMVMQERMCDVIPVVESNTFLTH